MIIHSLKIMRKTNFNLAPTFNSATNEDIISMIKLTCPSISTSASNHSTPISFAEQALHYVFEKNFFFY